MELFIKIQDGQPFEHPIKRDNFRQALPDVDTESLPSHFAKFERVSPPSIGVYEVYEGVTYEKVGDTYRDLHHVRDMTDEEIMAKQQIVKDQWASGPNWSSWSFDEATCFFVPPIPCPDDGDHYTWDESALAWVALS